MDSFFYCSYEGSGRGYVLTRRTDSELHVTGDRVPELIWDFFSHDHFRFLWMDSVRIRPHAASGIPENDQETAGYADMEGFRSFLGIRGLKGSMRDGRLCHMNLGFLAAAQEQEHLSRIAWNILGDGRAFGVFLSDCLSAGGEAGYQLDHRAFDHWMESCVPAEELKRRCGLFSYPAKLFRREASVHHEPGRTSLRLAVRTCSRERADEWLLKNKVQQAELRRVIDDAQFRKDFLDAAPVWTGKDDQTVNRR